MQLLDSLIDGALLLPDEGESQALIYAYVKFMRTGEEPEDLTGAAYAMWVSNRPVLENSRKKALSGSKGGKQTGKQTAKQTDKQNDKQTGKQTAKQNDEETGIKRASYQDSYSSSYSHSPFCEEDSQVDTGFVRPSREEVRSYFATSFLKGDPDSFWATYESQGWVKGNGLPIHDWHSQALLWSRRQVERDQQTPEDKRPKAPPQAPENAVDYDAEVERLEREYAAKYGGELQ